MNDDELLVLAAWAVNGGAWHPLTHEKPWSPLTDDGDALRLAVNLRLTIKHQQSWSNSDACMDVVVRAFECRASRDLPSTYVTYVRGDLSEKTREIERDFIAYMLRTGKWQDSAEVATRRAIVRAAAEIGKVTKGQQ